MAKYINADRLIEYIKIFNIGYAIGHDQTTFIKAIGDQPPVDVRENVHAYWIPVVDYEIYSGDKFQCSACGLILDYIFFDDGEYVYDFCPNCGAKMESGDNGMA